MVQINRNVITKIHAANSVEPNCIFSADVVSVSVSIHIMVVNVRACTTYNLCLIPKRKQGENSLLEKAAQFIALLHPSLIWHISCSVYTFGLTVVSSPKGLCPSSVLLYLTPKELISTCVPPC